MWIYVFSKWLALSQLCLAITGDINLTCDTVNTLAQSNVKCVCNRNSGPGIDWVLDDVFHTNCLLSAKICIPQYSGYNYSINIAENAFELIINSYNYSDCTKVTCKDASDGRIEQSKVPSSFIFDPNYPTTLAEPSTNNINGTISVTTSCISGYMDVKYTWYIISNGSVEKYTPDQAFVIDTTDTTSCVKCSKDMNGKRTIGFEHTEASAEEYKTVTFRVILSHSKSNSNITLESGNKYRVKDIHKSSTTLSDTKTTTDIAIASKSSLNIASASSDKKLSVTSTNVIPTSKWSRSTIDSNVHQKGKLVPAYKTALIIGICFIALISVVVFLCYCRYLRNTSKRTNTDQNQGESHNTFDVSMNEM